jgi:hypothetical protein
MKWLNPTMMEMFSGSDLLNTVFVPSNFLKVEIMGVKSVSQRLYAVKTIRKTQRKTHTGKVEKTSLLLSCPISPLFWHLKFHKPWDAKCNEWSFIRKFLD